MKIIRGTFRLSIVIALLIAVYYAISGYFEAVNADKETWRIWTTLRCGGHLLGKDVSGYTNEYGLIDLGRAGCSSKSFLATFEEIRMANARPKPPPDQLRFGDVFQFHLYGGLIVALAAFLAVNLLGFLFLGARSLFQWVRGGYR
jgi:hypothetical protein